MNISYSQGIKAEYIADIKLPGYIRGHIYELIGNQRVSVFRNQVKGEGLKVEESGRNNSIMYFADEKGWPLYKDKNKSETLEMNIFKQMVKDSIPLIQWEITHEFKSIAGIPCFKATGKMGGRIYDVWYAPSVPLSDGPHKLNGLPGLILEARSRDLKVNYYFKSLSYLTQLPEEVIYNLSYEVIPRSTYLALRKKHTENIQIRLRSLSGVTAKVSQASDYIEILSH